jgi:hypothetical protein
MREQFTKSPVVLCTPVSYLACVFVLMRAPPPGRPVSRQVIGKEARAQMLEQVRPARAYIRTHAHSHTVRAGLGRPTQAHKFQHNTKRNTGKAIAQEEFHIDRFMMCRRGGFPTPSWRAWAEAPTPSACFTPSSATRTSRSMASRPAARRQAPRERFREEEGEGESRGK